MDNGGLPQVNGACSAWNLSVDQGSKVSLADGASLNVNGWYENIGSSSGTGTFTQTGGTNQSAYQIRLGVDSLASGRYTLSGGSVIASGGLVVGLYGTGAFTHTGGTVTAGGLEIASCANSAGSYALSNSGSFLTINGDEQMGTYGLGTFTQSAGTHTITGGLYLGHGTGGYGSYTLSGGSVTTDGLFMSLSGGTSVFNQTGGTHTARTISVGGSTGGSATYNLVAGTLNVTQTEYIGGNGTCTFTQTGGAHTARDLSIAGPGTNGTYNMNAGTLSAGKIQINSGGAFTNSATVTITGANAGDVVQTGGIYTQETSGILNVQINGTRSEQFGQVIVGSASVAGQLNVTLGSGYIPATGDAFELFETDSQIQGHFDNIQLPSLESGFSWDTSNLYTTGTLTVVPEPVTMSLLVIGGLAMLRRQKRAGR